MELLTTRYADNIIGILGCYDRLVVKGTLPSLCYSEGMSRYLKKNNFLLFDYTKFADPFREKLKAHAEELALKHSIVIEFIRSSSARKEDIAKKHLDANKFGLVCILSAMEACATYKPWHDKVSHKTFLKSAQGKCLHYYFYFNDPDIGFGYVRVPTWCPFQLQVYFNGHNVLANQLSKKKMSYSIVDNAFDYVENFEKAQKMSDALNVNMLFKKLEWLSKLYCPIHQEFGETYHWSIMQCEYATDIIFDNSATLRPIYEDLIATAIHTVKPANICTFFGQKLHGNYEGEMGNQYNIRLEGSRIKHSMGPVSIKMYDKFNKILRIETTVNDVSFFKHYRTVEHRDGTTSQQQASVKKNIFSLPAIADLMKAANGRYLEFISAIEDQTIGKKKLEKITTPKVENDRTYKGFNFFEKIDQSILIHLTSGEFNISGFRKKDFEKRFKRLSSFQISRILKRLRVIGLIKKAKATYKYYMTRLGKEAILTALKLKNMVIIPELNYNALA
ncbi:MAG: hypothetical protein WKF97_21280 [Chitinophagaceae bacterium]